MPEPKKLFGTATLVEHIEPGDDISHNPYILLFQ